MADKELFCKDWNIDLTILIASQKIKNLSFELLSLE